VTAASGEIKKKEVKTPPAPPKTAPPKMQPKPEPSSNINKIITIALAILVLGGIVWAFFLYPTAPEQSGTPKPTATATVTQTPVKLTSTPVPEVTPTGKQIPVKLDSRRGFITDIYKINLGDEIIWVNDGKELVTLVSTNILDFGTKPLDYDKRTSYVFKKPGTYSFYLKENKNLNWTIEIKP
ncbi:MAG: hypothetical protein KKD69_01815, partial [Euryarchaeota archaeon]|nr:hypothetical protein [Euryarchaeota archaeon]